MNKKEHLNVGKEPIIVEGREEPPGEAKPEVIDGKPDLEGPDVFKEHENIDKTRSSIRTYLGVAAVAAVVGFVSGFFTGGEAKHYHEQITAYYAGDLNNDSYQDFAFKKRNGRTLIYLGQENGSWKRLKDIEAEMLRNLRDNVRGVRERAESKLQDIVE